jgi:hypothetical protein
MSEVVFSKCEIKGAFHWIECFGPVYRLNAYTIARYEVVNTGLLDPEVGKGDRAPLDHMRGEEGFPTQFRDLCAQTLNVAGIMRIRIGGVCYLSLYLPLWLVV